MFKALEFIRRERRECPLFKEDGAAVVEAAAVVPMILVIIMGSLFFLFFMLDMAVIKSETVRAANELALEWRKDKHMTVSEEETIMKSRIEKRLILTRLDRSSVTVSFGRVIAKAEVSFFLSGKGLSFSSCDKAAIDNREQWVRILAH